MDTKIEHGQLERKLLDMAYRKVSSSVIATIVLVSLIVVALLPVVAKGALLIWVSASVILTVLHIIFSRRYLRLEQIANTEIANWKTGFIIGATGKGLCWGSCILTISASTFDQTTVLLIFILAGVTAFASVSMAFVPAAAITFLISALLPLAAWLFSFDEHIYFVMGAITLAYMGAMMLLSRQIYRTTCSLLMSAETNKKLSAALMHVKQTEYAEAQKENDRRNGDLFSSFEDIIFFVDVAEEGGFTVASINPAAERAFGFKNAEVSGKRKSELFPAALAARLEAYDQACVDSGQTLHYEDMLESTSGKRYFSVTHIPIFNASGKVARIAAVTRDITERKLSEERLLKSEAQFRRLAENAPDPIYRYDRDCRRIYINPAVERLTGTPVAKLLNKSPIEAMPVPSADAVQVQQSIQRVLNTGKPGELEITFVAADGRECTVLNMLVPEFAADGSVETVLCVGREMSARKHMEQILRDSEREYRTLAENLPGNVIRYDHACRMRYLNKNIEELLRIPAAYLLGKTPSEVFTDGIYDELELVVKGVIDTGEGVDYDVQLPDNGNGERYHRMTLTPEKNERGEVIGVLNIGRDITEQKLYEQELLARVDLEQRLTALTENIPGFVFTIRVGADGHTSFPYASAGIEQLFGLRPEDVRDDAAVLRAKYHPDDLPRIHILMAETERTLTPFRIEIRIANRNNQQRWIEIRSMPQRRHDGATEWHGVMLDITERKEADSQLKLLNYALDHVNEEVFLVEENADLSYVNGAACRGRAYTKEELLKLNITVLDPNFPMERWPDHWRELKENGSLHFETLHTRKNGQTFPVEISANYFEFDGKGYNLSLVHDITERLAIENALKASENMLQEAQRIAHVGSWDVDMVNDRLVWSDELFRIWEINKAQFKATFAAFLETVHPEDRERVTQAYNEAIHNHSLYEVEHRLLFPDGRIKYILERGEPQFDTQGKPVRFIGTSLDITERKEVEQAQTKLARALRLLSESGMLLVHAKNERELLEDACRFAVEIGGYWMAWVGFAENDVNKTVRPVAQSGFADGYLDGINVTWADTEGGQGPIAIAIRTGAAAINHDFQSGSALAPWREEAIKRGYRSSIALPLVNQGRVLGSLNIYSAEVQAFNNNEEVALLQKLADHLALGIGILRTRSAQARMEAELVAREQEFRTLVENSPDSIYRYDCNGRRLYVNRTVLELTGLSKEELLGSPSTDRKVVSQADAEKARRCILNAVETGQYSECEVEFISLNGTPRIFHNSYAPEFGTDGKVQSVLSICRDITERKRMESALREQTDFQETLLTALSDAGMQLMMIENGRVVFVGNRELARQFGYTDTELDAHPALLDLIHPDERIRVAENYQRRLAGENVQSNYEMGLVTKGGERRDYDVAIAIVPDSNPARIVTIGRDVTERKRMESEIFESRNFLNKIIDSIPDPIFVKDKDHRWVLSNDAFCNLIGQARESLIGKSDYDFLPKEQSDVFWEKDEAVFSSGVTNINEEAITGGDGELRYIHTKKTPFTSLAGESLLVGVIRDITERKHKEALLENRLAKIIELNDQLEVNARDLEDQAVEFEAQAVELEASQEQIKLTEAWYRGIVRSAPDGMVVVNENGNISLVNLNIEKMFGYGEDELIGNPIRMLLSPEAWQRYLAQRDGFFANSSVTSQMDGAVSDMRGYRKDGTAFPLDISLSHLPDTDGKAGVICTAIRDVTERKRLEDILVAREYEFRMLVENIPDVVVRYDRECRRRYVNPAWERVNGISADKVIGKSPQEVAVHVKPVAFDFENKLREVMASRRSSDIDLVWKNEADEEVCFALKAIPEFNDKGEVMSLLTLARDITARKRSESALEYALSEAMRLAQLRSAFLAQMSHELRTPLNGILGYTQNLLHGEALAEKQVDGLRIIQHSGEHLLSLINGILDHAAIEAGKFELILDDIELEPFLGTVIGIIRVRAEQKNIAFTCVADDGLPAVVRGDAQRLRQVLLNLLSNAVKFTDNGEVILRVNYTAPSRLHFAVQDSGVGIAADQLNNIFLPFEQVGEISRRAGGTGLGLAICRKLVALMGSDIKVESQPGAGSTFSFEIEMAAVHTGAGTVNVDALSRQALTHAQQATSFVCVPPRQELDILHGLALRGNMRDVIKHATHLSELDQRYQPFSEQVRQLAKIFQTKALVSLIEQYRNGREKF